MLELTREPIDSGLLSEKISDNRAGALCIFEGRVRNNHLGRAVVALEYEAAPLLAKNEYERIISPILSDVSILGVLCVHRLGRLYVGEAAIWLGVLAGHRAEAFATCEYLMSEIKRRMPIWKKEFYEDGTVVWVENACGCV